MTSCLANTVCLGALAFGANCDNQLTGSREEHICTYFNAGGMQQSTCALPSGVSRPIHGSRRSCLSIWQRFIEQNAGRLRVDEDVVIWSFAVWVVVSDA